MTLPYPQYLSQRKLWLSERFDKLANDFVNEYGEYEFMMHFVIKPKWASKKRKKWKGGVMTEISQITPLCEFKTKDVMEFEKIPLYDSDQNCVESQTTFEFEEDFKKLQEEIKQLEFDLQIRKMVILNSNTNPMELEAKLSEVCDKLTRSEQKEKKLLEIIKQNEDKNYEINKISKELMESKLKEQESSRLLIEYKTEINKLENGRTKVIDSVNSKTFIQLLRSIQLISNDLDSTNYRTIKDAQCEFKKIDRLVLSTSVKLILHSIDKILSKCYDSCDMLDTKFKTIFSAIPSMLNLNNKDNALK
jgi:DNA polymerase IIIc chi subunit